MLLIICIIGYVDTIIITSKVVTTTTVLPSGMLHVPNSPKITHIKLK